MVQVVTHCEHDHIELSRHIVTYEAARELKATAPRQIFIEPLGRDPDSVNIFD